MYHVLKGVIPHFALIPLSLCHTLSLFWSNFLPFKRVMYFLNGPLVFCMIILFDFLSFEVPTSRSDIFAGIDFRKFFVGYFAGINFCYSEFTKDFTESVFTVTTSTKILWESNFAIAFRNNFIHDPTFNSNFRSTIFQKFCGN